MTYIVSSGALNSTHSLTHSEGIIKSRDTTGISDREYREYRDITQERIVYHDILKNVDRPMSSFHPSSEWPNIHCVLLVCGH